MYYERIPPPPARRQINVYLLHDLAKSTPEQPHRVTTAVIQRNILPPSPKTAGYLLSRIQVSAKASRSIHESATFEGQPLNTQHDSLCYPPGKSERSHLQHSSVLQVTILFSYKNTRWLNHCFTVTPKLSPLIIMCPCFSPPTKQEP